MVNKTYDGPHFDLSNFSVTETIKMLSNLLEKIIQTNDGLQHLQPTFFCFRAKSIPQIDINTYLKRILKYCPCANECFLSLLVYFDRMSQQRADGLRIDSYNVHRLLISGIVVSTKFFSDVFFTNIRYAKVGGLPVTELNLLEIEFLKYNKYNVYVSNEELQQYGDLLLMHSIREKTMNSTQTDENQNL